MGDRDTNAWAALQEAKESCGEERPILWQHCFQHEMKGSHRILNKNLNLKVDSGNQQSTSPIDPDLPFSCPKCSKGLRSAAGRATHARFCRVEPPPSSSSSGPSWLTKEDIAPKELKAFKKKLLHWVMVRKSNELRRGVAKYKRLNGFSGDNDLELKHRLKRAAGTILPCLKGDHSNCNQYSAVCADSKDPFLHLLPCKRNVSSIPDNVSKTIAESIWSVFRSEKLDYLIRGGTLRTTSRVEAVHRTIRNPAPKGKPMPKNQSAVLKFGATIAATNGRGLANVRHFQSLGLPMSAKFQTDMQCYDHHRHQTARRRKTAKHREQALALRQQKFEAHSVARESKEAEMYRKEGFGNDHSYARQSRLAGELGRCCVVYVYLSLLTTLFLIVSANTYLTHFSL